MKRGREWKVLVNRATHALHLGRADEAEALARRALQAALRKPEALNALADLAVALEHESGNCALLDEVTMAVATLDQTPSLRPRQASAAWHCRVGWAHARQGRLDEAARAFGEALALAPEHLESWRGLARARHGLDDVDGALEAWPRVIALSPADWEAHNDAGGAFLERNDWASAEAAFAAAAEFAPDQPIVIANRATLDVRRGRHRAAVAALEACLARWPDYAPASLGLGFALRARPRRFARTQECSATPHSRPSRRGALGALPLLFLSPYGAFRRGGHPHQRGLRPAACT